MMYFVVGPRRKQRDNRTVCTDCSACCMPIYPTCRRRWFQRRSHSNRFSSVANKVSCRTYHQLLQRVHDGSSGCRPLTQRGPTCRRGRRDWVSLVLAAEAQEVFLEGAASVTPCIPETSRCPLQELHIPAL